MMGVGSIVCCYTGWGDRDSHRDSITVFTSGMEAAPWEFVTCFVPWLNVERVGRWM